MQSPDRAIFRLVGEWYDRVAERKLLGENFMNMVADEHKSFRSEILWNAASIPCGLLANGDADRPSGRKIKMRGLTLPVRPNSPQEPMRLYIAADIDSVSTFEGYDSVKIFPMTRDIDYVDIGYGVPD